ncbi:MAG: short-chain dehydrogenase [Proteobacteria bacterium]|nr:MAG: short-chain dehydrogenase [Pseudomonadota bacterium]
MTVTVVTGASSGIGRSLARRLALRGDPVALWARRKPLLDALAAEIAAGGGRALAVACDVTEAAQVAAALRASEAAFGPVERLVANAGGGEPTFVDAFRADDVRACLDLNVVGVARCFEAVLPGMLARRAGHLVVVGSLAAVRGLPSAGAYAAAKAALHQLAESLRIDLRGRGVDVTVLAPGPVRTKPKSKKGRGTSIDVEDATARMLRAIDARRRYAAFPALVVAATTFGRLLPAALYERLLAGRGRTPKPRSAP